MAPPPVGDQVQRKQSTPLALTISDVGAFMFATCGRVVLAKRKRERSVSQRDRDKSRERQIGDKMEAWSTWPTYTRFSLLASALRSKKSP